MPSLEDHINARDDQDLRERVTAAAERLNVPNAAQFVQNNMGHIVSVDIGGTTIADVHAYAVATYDPPSPPGENPAAVTDTQILEAVTAAST